MIRSPRQVTARVLCEECERRFNRNGESEVLRWLAPKLGKKEFPLLRRLDLALPEATFATGEAEYSGPKVGVDARKFGYFALSLAWRASVHAWRFMGEAVLPYYLGSRQEPIRRFLLDRGPFPFETAVVVIVCRDATSREYWIAPAYDRDGDAWKFWIVTRGVWFIVWFGAELRQEIRESCCYSRASGPLLLADCEKRTRSFLGPLPTEVDDSP